MRRNRHDHSRAVRRGLATFLAAAALCAAAAAVCKYHAVLFHAGDSVMDGTYLAYHGREGFSASFVKGYRLDDSVAVDLVFVKAENDSAWGVVCGEMGFSSPSEVARRAMRPNAVTMRHFWDEADTAHTGPKRVVAASYHRRTMAIFRVESESQEDAIYTMVFDVLKHKRETLNNEIK